MTVNGNQVTAGISEAETIRTNEAMEVEGDDAQRHIDFCRWHERIQKLMYPPNLRSMPEICVAEKDFTELFEEQERTLQWDYYSGIVAGRVSALRWVLGNTWDNLYPNESE